MNSSNTSSVPGAEISDEQLDLYLLEPSKSPDREKIESLYASDSEFKARLQIERWMVLALAGYKPHKDAVGS